MRRKIPAQKDICPFLLAAMASIAVAYYAYRRQYKEQDEV